MAFIDLKVWETPRANEDKDVLITAIFIALSFFMLLYIGSAGGSSIFAVFANFISTSYIIGILSFSLVIQLYSRNRPTSQKLYASVGYSKNYFWGMILGTIVGVILILENILLPTPQASTIAYDQFVALIYIATVIPFAEEKFFGRTVPYLTNSVVKNPFLSWILTAGIFSFFHLISKGLNYSALAFSLFFRLAITLINEKTQASGFGDSLHYVQNFLSAVVGGGK